MHWGYSGEQCPPGASLRGTDVPVWWADKEEPTDMRVIMNAMTETNKGQRWEYHRSGCEGLLMELN